MPTSRKAREMGHPQLFLFQLSNRNGAILAQMWATRLEWATGQQLTPCALQHHSLASRRSLIQRVVTKRRPPANLAEGLRRKHDAQIAARTRSQRKTRRAVRRCARARHLLKIRADHQPRCHRIQGLVADILNCY